MRNRLTYLLIATMVLSVFRLASAHETDDTIKVEVLAKSENSWDGTSLPDFSKNPTEVTVLRITIAPRATLPMHKHPVINAGYMVEGELTVHTEKPGEILHLKKGDAIIELVNKWHYGVNLTEKPVVIVVTYFGTTGTPLTVKQATKIPEKKAGE